jgi:hypothetical protein
MAVEGRNYFRGPGPQGEKRPAVREQTGTEGSPQEQSFIILNYEKLIYV